MFTNSQVPVPTSPFLKIKETFFCVPPQSSSFCFISLIFFLSFFSFCSIHISSITRQLYVIIETILYKLSHLWFPLYSKHIIYVMCLSCFHFCSLLPCGHLKGNGWPLGSCLWCLLWFCFFPIWYPWIGVVLDCIDFWSLLSFLLSLDIGSVPSD